jgi:DNA-binding CsgD family transcriptional regulator
MKTDVLDVIQAAYRLDLGRASWLRGVAETAHELLGSGMGLLGFDYTVTPDLRVDVGEVVGIAMPVPEGFVEQTRAAMAMLPPAYVERTFTKCECTTRSEAEKADSLVAEQNRGMNEMLAQAIGVRDILMAGGMDPSGNGIYLGAWFSSVTRLALSKRRTWSRVAVHVVSALRLRKRLPGAGPLTDGADAILTPAGRVDGAEGEAQESSARNALRKAVRDLEHARSSAGRRDPDGAVAQWTALVDGRWSLVDQFDSDGRRYIVAQRNDVHVAGYAELSERERQVLAYASLGHANKLIAYELGIADSTVRVLLHRAATKLGASSRDELVAKYVAAREARS